MTTQKIRSGGHTHIKETAKSHVKALCDWFGIEFVDIDTDGSQPTEPLYARQVNTPGDTLNVRGARPTRRGTSWVSWPTAAP